jgi:hypothetical protein
MRDGILKQLIRSFALSACLLAAFVPVPARVEAAHAPTPAAQCPRQDTPIFKRIRFARGRTTAVVRDTIRLCTSHEYRLRARAGQTMSVHLATGRRTSFIIYSASEHLEGADGVTDWSGELPETGEYTIAIGTDATARYTLEVTIR